MTETRILHAEGASLTIFPDAPAWNGRRTAALGRLDLPSAEVGAAVLRRAAIELRREGVEAILAPMDGDTWHSYRVVTESDGSPPFPMEPTSGAHDFAALTAAGFAAVVGYSSARAEVSALPMFSPAIEGIAIAAWDGDPSALADEAFALAKGAFAEAAFYKPISHDAFLALYAPLLPRLDPGLVLLARDRQAALVGFLLGYPDGRGGAVVKTYAGAVRGVGRMLVDAFNAEVRARGLTSVVHALMRDDNTSRDRSRTNGGRTFRRYALLGQSLG